VTQSHLLNPCFDSYSASVRPKVLTSCWRLLLKFQQSTLAQAVTVVTEVSRGNTQSHQTIISIIYCSKYPLPSQLIHSTLCYLSCCQYREVDLPYIRLWPTGQGIFRPLPNYFVLFHVLHCLATIYELYSQYFVK
jgi:hypothetical protein